MIRGHLISNSRLLKNLNTHINEDHLLNVITQLSAEVNKIEFYPSTTSMPRSSLLLSRF